jgi:MoxR-like ATPase
MAGPSTGTTGIDASDPDWLVVTFPGRPDIRLPRIAPDTDVATATPHAPATLHGQDEYLYRLAYGFLHRDPTLVLGPTGCGKTASIRLLCSLLGWSFVMLSVDPDCTKGDLIGEALVPPDAEGEAFPIRWIAGPAEVAIRRSQVRPTCFVIDEINRAHRTSIYASLYPVLDGSGSLMMPGGERLAVGDLMVCATANPADDTKTQYEVREIDPALADRFTNTCAVTYPEASTEAVALMEQVTGLDADMARRTTEAAAAIRASQDVTYPFGFRTLQAWAKAVAFGIDPLAAAESTFVPKAPVEDREALRSYVQTYFPKGR